MVCYEIQDGDFKQILSFEFDSMSGNSGLILHANDLFQIKYMIGN